MSVFLVAQKSDQNVIEGQKYQVGGLMHNSERVVLFDCPGRYSLSEVFGVEREAVITAIKSDIGNDIIIHSVK
jgi:hypothetical protein